MTYYSAYYGNWNAPGGVKHVDFGDKYGIKYLYKTTNYHEAFDKAQEIATKTGEVVTILKDRVSVGGYVGTSEKVYPIRGKIKFVRMYKMYRENWYDVVYHSGRVVSYLEPDLPATVERFVESSTIRKQQYDKAFHRDEMLYF